jgi:hypothetical protein
MGIEVTPDEILKMGDEFDRDNEVNDIKFVDRIRYNQDDFHVDLFSNILEFLGPLDLVRFSRVSRSWLALTSRNDLWKKFCTGSENLEKTSWKKIYMEAHTFTWDLDCGSFGTKLYGIKRLLLGVFLTVCVERSWVQEDVHQERRGSSLYM